jgi:spore maturation protein CgeB
MRIILFYHSLLSDWNHGNAHFLRGIVAELMARGHDLRVYEPADAWSVQNLTAEYGEEPIHQFTDAFPRLAGASERYNVHTIDLDTALDGADVVIVHEWNDHGLVKRIGEHRARAGARREPYTLLFHDTHHRAVTQPEQMAAYDLRNYEGVLAFGEVLRDRYLLNGWTRRAWTWHEAADTRVFRPRETLETEGDVVWIGNWGDEERTAELHEFLLDPIKQLGVKARVHGVRYPEEAKQALAAAGIEYASWLPNYLAPQEFAKFRLTVHVPRRPYIEALPGIPTIRVFEALACGIPLICSPWRDVEQLFIAGKDFLVARDGEEMKRHMRAILHEPDLAAEVAMHGRRTVLSRHTCAHRVDELLKIVREIESDRPVRRRRAHKTPQHSPRNVPRKPSTRKVARL